MADILVGRGFIIVRYLREGKGSSFYLIQEYRRGIGNEIRCTRCVLMGIKAESSKL
jgi:hypothetical protein